MAKRKVHRKLKPNKTIASGKVSKLASKIYKEGDMKWGTAMKRAYDRVKKSH